jgi:hypothetical protein
VTGLPEIRPVEAGKVEQARRMKFITCTSCGEEFAQHAWIELALHQRVAPDEVSRLIRGWPEDLCIEVRACSGCAHLIAVKSPWSLRTVDLGG